MNEMNVLDNRFINKTIVLGCGKTILNLTQQEIAHINQCKIVIAMNKYMAFYKKIGIIPTHVYFVDDHENSRKFLQFIFNVCSAENLAGLTFILNEKLKPIVYSSFWDKLKLIGKNLYNDMFQSAKLLCIRYFFKTKHNYIKKLPHNKYQFISTTNWLEGGSWANNLTDPLFHYRGSLTTVINYCTICSPSNDIYLVGNDFNGSEYFFEKELQNLPFDWKDWTTEPSKKENRHFAFVDFRGTNITDAFPIIHSELKKRNINLYCTNPKSLLVSNCNVLFRSIL